MFEAKNRMSEPENNPPNQVSNDISPSAEQVFENRLLAAICKKLIDLGEIKTEREFIESYPKENLADIHNQETGAYYLMSRDEPIKLVEYNLVTFTVY